MIDHSNTALKTIPNFEFALFFPILLRNFKNSIYFFQSVQTLIRGLKIYTCKKKIPERGLPDRKGLNN